MKAATMLALALALGACSGGRPTLVDPDGTLRFAALDEVEPTVDGSRVKWELPNDVTITMQRVAVTDSLARGRNVDDVVDALAQRFALGEVEGALDRVPCAGAQLAATCTDGRIRVAAGLFVRRGMALRVGDDIVLLEAIGPERAEARVREQALLMQQTLMVL